MEKENKKRAKTKKRVKEEDKNNSQTDTENDTSTKVKVKRNKKSKSQSINNSIIISEEESVKFPESLCDENESFSNGTGTVKKHKMKNKNAENMPQIKTELIIKDEVNEGIEDAHGNENIDWPQKDLSELIRRIEQALPEKDNLAYSTRAEKLNWEEIGFNEYSGEDCKRTWLLIQKRVRRFRLLNEVLQDAKEWISKPWTNFYRGNKTKRHPDMPRRPLSVYMIFYLKKKDKILVENPGMEMTEVSKLIAQMYKSISPAKRAKYMQLAANERRSYEGKIEQFYRSHPEIPRFVEKPAQNKSVDMGPKKPLTPFGLYYEAQLKKIPADSDVDRNLLKEQCKEQWRNLSDKKKVVWIDWALDREAKYLDELKNYKSQNPQFSPILKPILTKEEKLLKERLAGKPVKPPNSAYSLFSRMMLQSEEIKKIHPKDRMKAIADQWKSCSDKEKKQYRERANHMIEQYKLDFASYLESLPEEKRLEELQNNLPKRKAKPTPEEGGTEVVKKKKKKINIVQNEDNNDFAKVFEAEPIQPPVSGFSLFSKKYQGKLGVEAAWKSLSKHEKKEYEEDVKKLKHKYIKEYEKFLKSLSKEQLTAFSQLRRKREGAPDGPDGGDEKSEESAYSCDSGSDNESSDANVEQD